MPSGAISVLSWEYHSNFIRLERWSNALVAIVNEGSISFGEEEQQRLSEIKDCCKYLDREDLSKMEMYAGVRNVR